MNKLTAIKLEPPRPLYRSEPQTHFPHPTPLVGITIQHQHAA
ncbi:MAG: hypothetical protein NWF04_02355 [Candidatus Bathyarchaeota archaeon]|nr:hypothetical protein [Candidatus Bathyarchaeota archaeon]